MGSVPLLRQQARYMNAALHDARNQQGERAPCRGTCTLQPPSRMLDELVNEQRLRVIKQVNLFEVYRHQRD